MTDDASPDIKRPSLHDAFAPLIALAVLDGFTGFEIERITPERTAPSEETS